MMPEGVEHPATENTIPPGVDVTDSMMPEGVEHTFSSSAIS